MSVPNTFRDVAPVDDPLVKETAAVFDDLTEVEKRAFVITIAQAVAAYKRTGNIDHLTELAESVFVTTRLRANSPEYVQACRTYAPPKPVSYEDATDVDEMLKRYDM